MIYGKNEPMLIQFFKDPWTYIASIGTAYFLAIEWISTHATPLVAFIGAIGGVVMIIMGILEKWKKNKMQDLEIKKLRKELGE